MKNLLKLVVISFVLEKSFSQVTLAPVGEIHVCKGNDQPFKCMASPGALWTVSGFGSGIEDTISLTNANSYAGIQGNERVESNDSSAFAMPSFLTFKNLGYGDDNAVVACLNGTQMGAMTTIRIGPPHCTVDFSVMTSGVTIIVNLTVYVCVGYLPVYEVVLSTTDNEPNTVSIEIPAFMASTILRISDQSAFSEYNVSLKLVDPYCQNATVATRLVVTDLPPPVALPPARPSPTATSLTTAPSFSDGCGGITAGVAVGCLFLSLLASMATGFITFFCTRRCYKKSSPPPPNEKSVYYETVRSDSVQMQPSPAYESVEKKM